MLGVLKLRTSSLSFTVGEFEMRVAGHYLAWAAVSHGRAANAQESELSLHYNAHLKGEEMLGCGTCVLRRKGKHDV
jgi:hypothetical protein